MGLRSVGVGMLGTDLVLVRGVFGLRCMGRDGRDPGRQCVLYDY